MILHFCGVWSRVRTRLGLNEDMTLAEAAFAFSPASFSIGPNPNALVGHVLTQAGSSPLVTLDTQKSHFLMVVSSGNWGAPNGQAVAQAWQPMQKLGPTVTIPPSGLFEIALVGQTAMQGASPQCIQARET